MTISKKNEQTRVERPAEVVERRANGEEIQADAGRKTSRRCKKLSRSGEKANKC